MLKDETYVTGVSWEIILWGAYKSYSFPYLTSLKWFATGDEECHNE